MGSTRFVLAAVAATCISVATGASAQDGAAGAGTEEVDQCRRDPGVDGVVAEDRAYEHYERGLNLYEQGDYEAAVEEFVLAYCHKPSPSVLKDIGQSFERLVDYEKAVVYLERYIAEAPDSEAEARRVQSARVQVLRNLPARVRIATEPPGATVTLTGPAGVSARGLSSAGEPLQVRHGTYALTVELAGHDPVHESIEVKIGQPYSYYFRLQRKKGTVRVVAVPSDARIFVNQRWVAIGNYVDQLPIDTYTVSAEADGWTTREVQIEVTEGNQRDVVLELERVPRSGRTELVAAAAIGGGVWGSGTLVKVLGDTTVTGSLGAALGIGLGLGSAYLGVPADIPQGHSSYIMGTTLIGATEGLLMSSLIMRQHDGDVDVDVASGVALATGAVALLGSALTASRVDLDAGDAALINSGALWGTLSGVLFWTVFDQDTRILEPLLLGGLNIGLVTGILLARSNQVSRSHVALIDLSGLVGLVVLTPFATITSEDGGINERTPHFALLGLGLGLITGTYFTRHMDEPSSFGSVRPSLGTASDAGGRSIMSIGLESRF